jgi:phosphoribosylformimino-5-aminoimidazole carboxamide ribotide isomerase
VSDLPVLRALPAIDLRGGRCVRLYQGDFDRETVYGDDPVAQARAFEAEGADWIHVVDLDAARSGTGANRDVIRAIAAAVDVPVQCGGGVRSEADARALAECGVARVVIGTAALEQPELVQRVAARQLVAVGIDARGDDVAVHGWESGSGRSPVDVAAQFADVGVDALVVTEISRDGTMDGADVAGLRSVLAVAGCEVIASGGIGTLDHLRALREVSADGRTLGGVIMGRALYEQAFTLAEAVRVLGGPA